MEESNIVYEINNFEKNSKYVYLNSTEMDYNSVSLHIQPQYLKNMYKKYVNHIINMESHINKLYQNWIIDINTKNSLIYQIDALIRKMTISYNSNLKKNYKEFDDDINLGTEYLNSSLNYISSNHYELICDNIDIINQIDKNNIIDDPFIEIKNELLDIGINNGFLSMGDFFNLHTNAQYTYLFNKNDIETIELYNKVFVPINVSIIENTKSNLTDTNFSISKYYCKCDCLVDNTCTITIYLASISTKIIMDGYICAGGLNTYIKTSKLCSRYIFNVKQEAEIILKKNNIDFCFYTKYSKIINNGIYFANNSMDLAEKIINDYVYYNELQTKSQNLIIKDFLKSNLKEMFRMINILLIGENQCINTATLLFELLKNKKISSITISDIIYKNLPYCSQLKLKYTSENLKNEVARIKTLTIENISIETRLSAMVNMPDNVKNYILERNNEIKSGENNYKIQTAINGLMQFPWKPLIEFNATSTPWTDIIPKNSKSLSVCRNYLQNVAKKLNENVYGHNHSKQILIELIGKWIQNPNSTGQVIGLSGPPGVGKTLFAKSLSESLNIPLSVIGLGGMSDASDLIGHSFTYSSAQYGMIIRQMIKAGKWRSILFFDEVDKVSKKNETNEIYNTLIHITDPIMSQHFQDRFYSSSIDFDISGTLIIFSYNSSDKIDPILLDRIKEITVSAYSVKDKILIAKNYIMKELCLNIGFDASKIIITDALFQYIIENYTIEAGVRDLRRKIEEILLKINMDRLFMKGPFKKLLNKKYLEQLATENNEIDPKYNKKKRNKLHLVKSENDLCEKKNSMETYINYSQSTIEKMLDPKIVEEIFNLESDNVIILDMELLHTYLDKPTYKDTSIYACDLIGVVNGLYATDIGIGGIIPIQIYKNYTCKSNNSTTYAKLKITGNQKQVMKESVICALTVAINIVNDSIKKKLTTSYQNGFHVHAPDGGTPKDGPSAGCAFATAFISLLLGKKINRYISMTGEIDLTGKICKIGGLYAKLTGAKKAGITIVFISEENKIDYDIIKQKNPELFIDELSFKIIIVKHIIDIVTNPNVMPEIDIANDFDQSAINKYKLL